MGLFYTASTNEMVQTRKKVFLDHGLPALYKNGFEKSPFAGIWFGHYPNIGYIYALCRLSGGQLEMITTNIVRGDRWIQIHLNIFELNPAIESLSQLQGLDGLQFELPPNSETKMRLRSDDIQGPPLFDYHYWFRNHKIKSYYSKSGLEKRAEQLGRIIAADLSNIDWFIKRWHELHKPLVVDWRGKQVDTK